MRTVNKRLLAATAVTALASGCAYYRTESNITPPQTPPAAVAPATKVVISQDALPQRKYQVLGPIEVSIKKLTIFHNDPTKEMADEALSEKAKVIGADGVINVTYKSGVGLTTWGVS
ncbi:MAG: hypothetical protein IPN53_08465 [Comamonadaceae bacterium]|nr:hypothetical protein [Comamonadaceae bacterium]